MSDTTNDYMTSLLTISNAAELAAGICSEVLGQCFYHQDGASPTTDMIKLACMERIAIYHELDKEDKK